MSIFNINNVPKDEKREFADIPEGKYDGTIIKVEEKKTKAGHKVLNLQIKTDVGSVFTGLNFDHPACAAITQKTVANILQSFENPPQEVETLSQLGEIMKGLPVNVFVKPKGKSDNGFQQYGVYFNQIDGARKVKIDSTGAVKKRVEY